MAAANADDDEALILPDEHRGAFKDPLGELYTEATALLAAHDGPVITIGDVVTATMLDASYQPAVAVVDGITERDPVDAGTRATTQSIESVIEVSNPPATITYTLARALVSAIETPGSTRIEVDGEEDLAVIPAILAAPLGATVVYGQPGEGMVAVDVTEDMIDRVLELLTHLEGDIEVFLDIVGGDEA